MIQETRPNKRLFHVTDEGLAELERFAANAAKPSFIRDDLLVKVQAVDRIDAAPVIEQLTARARTAAAKAEILEQLAVRLRGGRDEAEFLAHGSLLRPVSDLSARSRLRTGDPRLV